MPVTFVLVHSPLVGPSTWATVSDELRRRGFETVVPSINSKGHETPYWQQHAMDVARAVAQVPSNTRLVLVGHSGAGPLLPAIRQRVSHAVAGYVFVDAGIPANGLSRLDLMALESPQVAEQFRDSLQSGARFPTWSDDDLREVIPDERLRAQVVDDLRPQPLAFFDEPIPVFDGWPDAPCAYIQFVSAYEVFADRARNEGWDVQRIEGGHFHMLVDPVGVSDALLHAIEGYGLLGP